MSDFKLIAFDVEDLNVFSAHLQDAVVRVADMAYLPKQKRFVLLLNRFDWEAALGAQPARKGRELKRKRAGLRFERVLAAQLQGFAVRDKKATLALLAVSYTPSADAETAEGDVTLTFSGGAAIRLKVECLEAELKDLGAAWKAKRVPVHKGEDG